MARIEWSALSGDEVETVVSMLIYNKHPRATRIRPSQGDFGIDVMVPHAADGALATSAGGAQDPVQMDVYQIKKFATNLESTQKTQIENSFRRVLIGLIRRGIALTDWYLVMPLDPTLENLDWFTQMPDDVIDRMFADTNLALTDKEKTTITAWRKAPDRIIKWEGLLYCESLASKYWFVADYYLHGGNERIRDAVAEVSKILQRDLTLPTNSRNGRSTSILEPNELRDHLQRLGRVLDGDPHFRYGFSIDPVTPQLLVEQGLVGATQEIFPDGSTLTFRIYARFSEATKERPIPIKLRFMFEPGSAEQQAFDDWRKYGKPVTLPAHVDVDFPGGLGQRNTDGLVSISAAKDTSFERRYRIVDPDHTVLAEVKFSLVSSIGPDGTGAWFHGHDPSGVLTIEGHADFTERTSKFDFTWGDATGLEAGAVSPAAYFVANLCYPNRLQVAEAYGAFQTYDTIPEGQEPLLPRILARYIRALAIMRDNTSVPFTIPDIDTVTPEEAAATLRTGTLLEGQTIVGTWEPVEIVGSDLATPVYDCELVIIQPLTAVIATQEITFGASQHSFLSARMTPLGSGRIKAEPHLNDTDHLTFAPQEPLPADGQNPVRYRVNPPPEIKAVHST